jgi:L-ascorbate metabolism protein UlaG (beta-lactamase superfamily)
MSGHARLPVAASSDELGITFIGHSSFLLQIGGLNLLVDPVFARSLIILRRLRRVGVRIDQLPPIDAVLISHAHMDHLNLPSLRKIVEHTLQLRGRPPLVIVPWGVDDLVAELGFERVITLEWWQSTQLGDVEITMTPAKHWGARFFNDSHRGFGGYVLRRGALSVYHAGDSAYFDKFAMIGKRLSPQIALLPIGAYRPDTFRGVHMNPAEAFRAFQDLGAQCLIPMHYGTFRLSQEPMDEPVPFLLATARAAGSEEKIRILTEGSTAIYSAARNPAKIRTGDPAGVRTQVVPALQRL